MKTTNEQVQMILEEFEMAWKIHLSELRTKGFSDKFIEMENSGKWLPQLWFIRGRLKSIEEIDELKLSLFMLKSSLQEKEQEIERMKVEVNEYGFNNLKSANKSIKAENDKIYSMLENLEKSNDLLKSKLPDQEELREAMEAYDEIATHADLPLNKELVKHLIKIKTFLESLGEK